MVDVKNAKREYDDKGNVIYCRLFNGYEYWQEFDDNGRLISYKDNLSDAKRDRELEEDLGGIDTND